MSRNAEYQFVETDTATLEAQLVSAYEEITGITVQPSSPEKLFINWVADIIVQERAINNYTGNQNIPSRAEGENLDGLAELFYLKSRPSASGATCTVRFYISEAQESAVLIPAGTRVTDGSAVLYWETKTDEYIPIGATSKDISVYCQTVGVVGNGYTIGQINTIVDVFDYYDRCENITESANGSDEATDDEFYQMLVSSQDAYSTAGPMGAYVYHAKSSSGSISDVVANSPERGVVCLYAIMDDGSIAGEETKSAMLAACNEDANRPLTDLVKAADPEEVDYNIELTYYMTRDSELSATDVQNLVSTAVQDYIKWQSERLGRDINPDKLRNMLLNIGVKRVDLKFPAFVSLRDGRPSVNLGFDPVPQIAKVGTVQVNSGGYEDD